MEVQRNKVSLLSARVEWLRGIETDCGISGQTYGQAAALHLGRRHARRLAE